MKACNASTVEFWFEFASPYAYLASERIEALCERAGAKLLWRPFMLGAIFKHTGGEPLMGDGARARYTRDDCYRWARMHEIPFNHYPAESPTNALKAARGALHLLGESGRASDVAAAYVHACFRAHWVEGRDLFDDAVLASIVDGLGLDGTAFFSAISDPALKQRLIDQTEHARLRGVFGAPTFFVGDQMLWGNDRLPLLERLLREGSNAAGPSPAAIASDAPQFVNNDAD